MPGTILESIARRYGYTRRELQGTLLLSIILAFLLAVPAVYRAYLIHGQPTVLATEAPLLDSVIDATTIQAVAGQIDAISEARSSSPAIQPFDPNTASTHQWQAMGAPQWLANRIDNYRKAGGRFRKAEDLRKIYNFPTELYTSLRPFIRIGELSNKSSEASSAPSKKGGFVSKHQYSETHKQPKPTAIIDINKADSAALEALPMIGSYTARAIVRYRERLGGFISTKQIFEVRGVDSVRALEFVPYLFVAKDFEPKPFPINAMADDYKLWHPYLPKLSTKLLRAYLRTNGSITDTQVLVEKGLMTQPELDKLQPYLKL